VKTWFGLDVLIVGSDWAEVVLSQVSSLGLVRFVRIFRIVRTIRLLRLVRMQDVVVAITERIQSDKIMLALSVMKMVVFVVGVSHFFACMWWGIGTRDGARVTWATESEYDGASLASQYGVSFSWALHQFAGGTDEVTPASALERFYAVVVWTFGFTAATIIVSVLTSNLTQTHIIDGAQSRHMATLRKFLRQNGVSSNLALRMQRNAQHCVSGDLSPDSVTLLGVVTEPLRVEMHFEMYASALRNHNFFADLLVSNPSVMRRVCHCAMSTVYLADRDVVFTEGESPPEPKMFFVLRGTLEYDRRGDMPTVVRERQWVAEANLWTRWTHRGTLTSTSDVKLAVMKASIFQEIMGRCKEWDTKVYASEFVAFFNKAVRPTDLTVFSD
jgi:hypothetical protein